MNLTTIQEQTNNTKEENFDNKKNYEIVSNCIIDKEIPLFNNT